MEQAGCEHSVMRAWSGDSVDILAQTESFTHLRARNHGHHFVVGSHHRRPDHPHFVGAKRVEKVGRSSPIRGG